MCELWEPTSVLHGRDRCRGVTCSPRKRSHYGTFFRDEVLQVLRHLNDVTVHYFRNNRYDVGQRVTRCLFWGVPIQQTPSPLPTRYS